ncbi:MAG: hypothetical protein WKG01_31350 [Kofleriaceae bacterium]
MTRSPWIALVSGVVSCVVVVGTAGCDRPAPSTTPVPIVAVDAAPVDAPGLDQDLPRLAERSVKLYQEVQAAFTAAREDCAAAARALESLRERYADVVVANAKILHDGRAKQLRTALQPHEEQLDAAAKAIVQSPTLSACSQDEPFARAFDQLVGAPP